MKVENKLISLILDTENSIASTGMENMCKFN